MELSAWLADTQAAIRGEQPADVPCNGCTACCTSAQFVHISPDETDTLAHVPASLLVPAPALPRGHVVLGFDARGHCPMLGDSGCTIYEHRPRTCRTYDCRVFAATGVEIPDKPLIATQAARWRFDLAGPESRARQSALRAAAAFLASHPDVVPDAAVARNPTQLAALAVQVHDAFMGGDPPFDVVRAAVTRATH